jgi:branched-chain amino acid transport system ATP-binding protein
MNVCHRILVLHHGKKIAEGTPKEVAAEDAVIKAYLGEAYVDA